MILLDTCVLLWLSDPSYKFPERVKGKIRATPPHQRFVSAISALEIAIKVAKGRLELSKPVQAWWSESCVQRRLTVLPVTDRICIRSGSLPALHADPADRVIIATAQEYALTILTSDANIAQYSDVYVSWK